MPFVGMFQLIITENIITPNLINKADLFFDHKLVALHHQLKLIPSAL